MAAINGLWRMSWPAGVLFNGKRPSILCIVSYVLNGDWRKRDDRLALPATIDNGVATLTLMALFIILFGWYYSYFLLY